MPLLTTLPPDLEDADALLRRRGAAEKRKEMWRSTYQECYKYAMPARETFNWSAEGQVKNNRLYDSTLQESTYEAANTMCALLFPSWKRWGELAPGGAIKPEDVTPEIEIGLQRATKTFFDFLNNSNFSTVINETALDLMVGTGSLDFDEAEDDDQPFVFSSVPLSAIELEEGPNGTIETTFMKREPEARNLLRMYPGMELFDLSPAVQDAVTLKGETKVEIIQGHIYHPGTKKYYGVVIECAAKQIIWRYEYGETCPTIVARATKMAGELYGRGRVMLALSDARTLDKMQEFTLRHSALQVGGMYTAVSDGVINPYNVNLAPGAVIPVASNDNGNPSLRALEVGGNFNITNEIMMGLRERVRRTMLGPEMSQGPIKTATEISLADRNRLWAMNGEFNRVQEELLFKIMARGIDILQRRGLIPKFKIDGREVTVRFVSPFARSQDGEDVLALQKTISLVSVFGPEALQLGFKSEDLARWASSKNGVDMTMVRTKAEQEQKVKETAEAIKQQIAMQQAQGQPAQPGAPLQ